MPRFFFNVSDGTTTHDRDGEQCQSVEQARDVADIIAKRLADKKPELLNHGLFIVVSDETGHEVYRTPLAKLHA